MKLESLLIVHLSATAFMCGVISICQWVHYPLMKLVAENRFVEYSVSHQRRISWIVLPVMVLELGTGVALLLTMPDARALCILGVGLSLLVWGSTALVQAPQHHKLKTGYDSACLDQLVSANRFRCLLWGARLFVAGLLILAQGT